MFLAIAAVLARVFDAAAVLRKARRGPWRAAVAEESMAPALLPGDWLLLDPTCRRWPRPGTVVVIREPGSGELAVKRVAVRGRRPARQQVDARGDHDARGDGGGPPGPRTWAASLPVGVVLGSRDAWVLGDVAGRSIDSRSYGPLDLDALVARAWFRYGPARRIGRLR